MAAGDDDKRHPPTRRPSVSVAIPERSSSSMPAAAAPGESHAERGAWNVVTRCLCAAPGERVHLLSYRGDALVAILARAVEEAGAVPVRVSIDGFSDAGDHLAALIVEGIDPFR